MGMATAVGTEAGVGGVAASLSTLFLPIAHDERSVLAFSSLHESAVQAELVTPSLPGPIHLSLLNYVVVFVTSQRGRGGRWRQTIVALQRHFSLLLHCQGPTNICRFLLMAC